jgi:hypothetical protein
MKRASVTKKYPSKTRINLVAQEGKKEQNVTAIAIFVLFLVALAAFTKFMVIDQMAKVNAAEAAYQSAEDQLTALKTANADYAEVRAEYTRFGNSYMTENELSLQDRAAMLEVIDQKLSGRTGIQNVSISGNVASLSVTADTTGDISAVVEELRACDIVSFVNVSVVTNSEAGGKEEPAKEAPAEEPPAEGETPAEEAPAEGETPAEGGEPVAEAPAETEKPAPAVEAHMSITFVSPLTAKETEVQE